MGIKNLLSPLRQVSALTDKQKTALSQAHIDSAEELLGLVKSDPEKAQSFLAIDKAPFGQA